VLTEHGVPIAPVFLIAWVLASAFARRSRTGRPLPAIRPSAVSSAPGAWVACPGVAVKIAVRRAVPDRLSVCAARFVGSWERAVKPVLMETAANSGPVSEAAAVPATWANVLDGFR
jgi:hypothetical protein